MDNCFNFLLEEKLDSKLIENFILILITITCFSTMFCCHNRTMYKYILISQEENKDEFVKGVSV